MSSPSETRSCGENPTVVSARLAFASVGQNRYLAGTTTYLEVVTAQTIALANERAAVDIQVRRMTASVNLIKALGGGWRAADLSDGYDGTTAAAPALPPP